jgi:signal transduction histidine kinase
LILNAIRTETPLPTLRPRARIIRTIGDQLISGPEAALIELVKNAYDADSAFALIKIVPSIVPPVEAFQNPSSKVPEKIPTGHAEKPRPETLDSPAGGVPEDVRSGMIWIADEGHGMSEQEVLEKWFEPATDDKLKRRTSPNGRVMLGAKGIGRFAAARLGRYTDLEAVSQNEDGSKTLVRFDIDWNVFDSTHYLDQVEISVSTERLSQNSQRPTGLQLTIRELRDSWKQKHVEELIRELRRVVSPSGPQESGFEIRLDITTFKREIFGFDGQELLTGLNFGAIEETASEDEDPFRIHPFTLQEHADYILEGNFDKSGGFEGTFTICRGDRTLQDIKVAPFSLLPEESSCGSFHLRINIFDREREAVESLIKRMGGNLQKIGLLTARKILTENAGIAIFRKGFRIRPYGEPDNDWLELERQRVQDPSRKLGLSQVSGIIEIGEEDDSGLIERSSREELEHNGSYDRLKRLVQGVLVHAEERRFQFRAGAGISRKIRGDLERARESASLRTISRVAKTLPVQYREVIEKAAQKDSASITSEIDELDEYQRTLESRAALGLVLSEVLHEGRRVLNPVASSAKTLIDGKDWVLEKTDRGAVYRKQFPGHAETIHSGVRDLGKLFKKLDPISGRRRGKPSTFKAAKVIERCLELFQESISQNNIRVVFEAAGDLRAYGYEDDLQAALMNIIDNAIYWLSTSSEDREVGIRVTRHSKSISISMSNTGPLIDDAYMPRLFDAGFTLKSNGTGLGLAIAREALRRSKGEITFDDTEAETTFILRIPAAE